jgi:hypothetical protein
MPRFVEEAMRSFLAVALICCSTTIAFGEEAYEQTANELGRCQGLVVRSVFDAGRRITPDAVDDLLKQKCGDLEERQEKEFLDFVSRQFGRIDSVSVSAGKETSDPPLPAALGCSSISFVFLSECPDRRPVTVSVPA